MNCDPTCLGWTSIILVSTVFVDYSLPKASEKIKYLNYVIVASTIGFFAESLVTALGVREYSNASNALMSGIKVFGSVPIEAIYYIPVFMALVIAFKKYWEIDLERTKNRRKG
ncbi:MAG: hypothetical protein Q7S74_06205 [Nanoarchaeota archaeon]|nr:hypothetical protein [Nanoarchaeota archaeon]